MGERDLDIFFFCPPGDAEPEELRSLRRVVTGDEESSSSSEPSEQSDFSGVEPGSLEPDLDLETSRSLDELARFLCSLSLFGARV